MLKELWHREDVPANVLLYVTVLWAWVVVRFHPVAHTWPFVLYMFIDQWRIARRIDDLA